jgi:subtilisin family serine protease
MRSIALSLVPLVVLTGAAQAEFRISVGARTPDELPALVEIILANYDLSLRHSIPGISAASFVANDSRVLAALRGDAAITRAAKWIEPVGRCSVPGAETPYEIEHANRGGGPGANHRPNDPDYKKQWPLPCISADQAWDYIQTGDVMVAIVDTGIDLAHGDLRPHLNTVDDWDFVNDDDYPMDDYGHGTHVAGIVGAVMDNGIGIAGAFQAELLAVKVLDSHGSGWWDDVAAGIDHAVAVGADAINMSLGGSSSDPILKAACDAAWAADVLVVAAAGNEGPMFFANYPATYTSVIGVGALGGFLFGDCEKAAFFSQRGFGDDQTPGNVEVMAPGKFVYSCYPNDEYARMDGTSMASPHVAALCAAYRAWKPGWSAVDIRHHIQANADELGAKFTFGYGRIDFFPPVD